MIRHTKIRVDKTGHIYHYGNSHTPKYVWLACHGYGQLAKNLIRKFDVLNVREHLVIAPEGLSRFYWKGVYGDVVGSWMTKEDRLDEISDYVTFLTQVWDKYQSPVRGSRVILFGFSQGCATMWRWILNCHPDFEVLVLWAGWLPEDMLYSQHLDYLRNKKILYIVGDHDQYYTKDREALLRRRFHDEGIQPEFLKYHGDHSVKRAFLNELWTHHIS